MFGISFYELIVVLIIFVILFKPKEIISILFKVGKILRNIKLFSADVQAKIEEITALGNPDDYLLKEQKKIDKENNSNTHSEIKNNKNNL